MDKNNVLPFIQNVLENVPADWLNLTTHRLDIYDEKLAKTQFLEQFETLYANNNAETSALRELRTAYDYIRLGHPLSCILEWTLAHLHHLQAEQVISFSSRTAPVLAVLRTNLLANKNTQIIYTDELPACFDAEVVRRVYGYTFEVRQVEHPAAIPAFEGSTIFIAAPDETVPFPLSAHIDFLIRMHPQLGSVLFVNGAQNEPYIPAIQHVRRRETIAMTPAHTLIALQQLVNKAPADLPPSNDEANKASVLQSIQAITGTNIPALVASSGLSMQYAIVMGLIHEALDTHAGKAIKIVVPPNCYGGTNDQARRVAACIDKVEVVDLPVDGGHDMAHSIDIVLDTIAKEDAVPLIIAEIPTNPRVEVPDLEHLQVALSKVRKTPTGDIAIPPVFVLDQTFCPNVHFLGESDLLASVRTIAYVSGSKFPSGGKCTAGYCVANKKAEVLMEKTALHLRLCDNEATSLQLEILAQQLPSMNQRIQDAYQQTRAFVRFISDTLPAAKINFASEELAAKGFTPSVFSLDLPPKGDTDEEREAYKRALNLKLIHFMIRKIPHESKNCVSYGQLKGAYWTIPATSTQGTTKEGDKDYIARVALSPQIDLDLHKQVFLAFVEQMQSMTEPA